jgi:hypothetical protein
LAYRHLCGRIEVIITQLDHNLGLVEAYLERLPWDRERLLLGAKDSAALYESVDDASTLVEHQLLDLSEVLSLGIFDSGAD